MPDTNPFIPRPMEIVKVVDEVSSHDILSFFLKPVEGEIDSYLPGQFATLSVFGRGEAPFGYASSPLERGHVRFSIKRTGSLTRELHRLGVGEIIGMRGALGNAFDLERLKGKNLIVVGGGYAFTTLRSLIAYLMAPENRAGVGDISLFYGVRHPGLFLYKEELEAWRKRKDLSLHLTVDQKADGWHGSVGVVPELIKKVSPSTDNALAVICGPPPMIRFALPVLEALGIKEDEIYISMERKMKCGVGLCGRCNIGTKFVCSDGPVFTLKTLREELDVF